MTFFDHIGKSAMQGILQGTKMDFAFYLDPDKNAKDAKEKECCEVMKDKVSERTQYLEQWFREGKLFICEEYQDQKFLNDLKKCRNTFRLILK